MKLYAIIVAGGTGSRMQTSVPKQFLLLDGIPVLMHTIQAFYNSRSRPEILVVLNKSEHANWRKLCDEYLFTVPHKIIEGGDERFHSVRNALLTIKGDGIVAIHDAVRPLVSPQLIDHSYEFAAENGNCIAGITPTDSIRQITAGEKSVAFNRNEFILVQTPQTFDLELLRKAYIQPYNSRFTDDASVVESAGFDINLIAGERENIKITHPEDLEIAVILKHKKSS